MLVEQAFNLCMHHIMSLCLVYFLLRYNEKLVNIVHRIKEIENRIFFYKTILSIAKFLPLFQHLLFLILGTNQNICN